MKTCLYRFLGNCKNCEVDYNPDHHPNNLDCPRYNEINIGTFYVIADPNDPEKTKEVPIKTGLERFVERYPDWKTQINFGDQR